jgi:rhodanese-related sulfurtransferase
MNQFTPAEITPRQLKEKLDAGEPVQLIDVREPQEFAVCRIEGAELIPMRAIQQSLPTLEEKAARGPLVVYCHHGIRSLQAVSWLRRQGFPVCQSLEGGIDRWSVLIDQTVPRY